MSKKYSFQVRTDLAIEVNELLTKTDSVDEIDGVEVEHNEEDDILVTWVKITNEKGQKAMGKLMGNYITLESKALKENDAKSHDKIIDVLSKNIIKLKQLDEDSVILVVGLGNWNVTADALGPQVIDKILVTRHIIGDVDINLEDEVRAVCAISPGVMGITGIETGEIIRGIVDRVKPDLVICIDSLAARRTQRLNATIQMTDIGVSPGSGVNNKRMSLDEKTLGVPVIAIGVPTVVDAATLINDTLDSMLEEMMKNTEEGSSFYKMLSDLENDDKYRLITEILSPYQGNMFVTPKDVDAVISRLADIIANAVNVALHPGVGVEDKNKYR